MACFGLETEHTISRFFSCQSFLECTAPDVLHPVSSCVTTYDHTQHNRTPLKLPDHILGLGPESFLVFSVLELSGNPVEW